MLSFPVMLKHHLLQSHFSAIIFEIPVQKALHFSKVYIYSFVIYLTIIEQPKKESGQCSQESDLHEGKASKELWFDSLHREETFFSLSKASRHNPGPTSLLFNGYLPSVPGVEHSGCESNYALTSDAQVKEYWSHVFPHMRFLHASRKLNV